MKRFIVSLLFFAGIINAIAQNPEAYRIYNQNGKEISWKKMVKDLVQHDIVFFGELHNNSVSHWLQLELAGELFNVKRHDLVLGAEMFEADNQLLLDEYLGKKIREKDFENEARLWDNYATDYKPLVNLANKHNLPFIATNVPRRYAALVNRNGLKALDSLSGSAKKFLPPLPIPFDATVECYANMMRMGGHMPGKQSNSENMAKAQALKDATMAHFIVKNMNKNNLFLHFNGRYHSDNHQGIAWYIGEYAPNARVATISTVVSADVSSLDEESNGLADYIIVVNENITKSY